MSRSEPLLRSAPGSARLASASFLVAYRRTASRSPLLLRGVILL